MCYSNKSWFQKLRSIFSTETRDMHTQLIEMLDEARRQKLIDSDAISMIKGVLEVAEDCVKDVMVSRSQIISINDSDELEDILALILKEEHSRYPVISSEGQDSSEVQGILIVKDILKAVVEGHLNTKEDLVALYREPLVVPEIQRLNVLLTEFKISRRHMAVVVDEYGELSGLITIEDVLEQIVGEIVDEHDEEETDMIFKHLQGGYTVDAMTPLEEFNTFFKVNIDEDLVETIGGAVNKELGHIPVEGEKIVLQGLTLEVIKADDRKVETLRVLPFLAETEVGHD